MAHTGKPGRKSRGLKGDWCSSCKGGRNPALPKTFDPRCEGCLAKVERHNQVMACACKQDPPCEKCCQLKALGTRTGLEPSPRKYCMGNFKLRNMDAQQREASGKRFVVEHEARRRAAGR